MNSLESAAPLTSHLILIRCWWPIIARGSDTRSFSVSKVTSLWSSVGWSNFQQACNCRKIHMCMICAGKAAALAREPLRGINEYFLPCSVYCPDLKSPLIFIILLITSFCSFFSGPLCPTVHFLIIHLSPRLPSNHLSPLSIQTFQSFQSPHVHWCVCVPDKPLCCQRQSGIYELSLVKMSVSLTSCHRYAWVFHH